MELSRQVEPELTLGREGGREGGSVYCLQSTSDIKALANSHTAHHTTAVYHP